MNNADYAMMLMEDTGVSKANFLELIAKQVGQKLTKEINQEIEELFGNEGGSNPSGIFDGIERRIHEEIMKILNVDSLDKYMVSGRVEFNMLRMEHEVFVYLEKKWVFRGIRVEDVRAGETTEGNWEWVRHED